ncbi:hypothetical protein TeGR_g10134 [Tetraparma gracilis]|uniref:EGF-like domain-containing protein n=1 Tax=Tetraparma gracilis TaxID=2962635 RepID=A0ABQ6MX35_9STRA|nr:hypothetical protein TeGR_g10134 [Tetraparma gracilis]
MKRLATMANALPLSNVTTYEGYDTAHTWDEEMVFGCVCDSSWDVGLGPNQRQLSEWFGGDCSLRRCPSGDDPRTADTVETNCNGVRAADSVEKGQSNNLCHVDCSNRGTCDYNSGKCKCYLGYYGEACSSMSALATGNN